MANDMLGIRINVDFEDFKSVDKKLTDLMNRLKKANKLDIQVDQKTLDNLQKQFDELKAKITTNAEQIKKVTKNIYIDNNGIEKSKAELTSYLNQRLEMIKASTGKEAKYSATSTIDKNGVANITSAIYSYTDGVGKARTETHKWQTEVRETENEILKIHTFGAVAGTYVEDILKAEKATEKLTNSTKLLNSTKTNIFNKSELDKNGTVYIKGVSDIIQKVQKLYGSMGEVKVDITKNIKGQVEGIIATVTKADGIVEKFKMNLATIQQNGRNYSGFVTTGSKVTDNSQAIKEAQLKEIQRTNQAIDREQQKQIANNEKLIQQEQIRVQKLGTMKGAIPSNLFSKSDAEIKQYIKSLYEANSKISSFQRTTDSLGNSQIKLTVNTKNAKNEIERERVVLDQLTASSYRNGESLRTNSTRMLGFSDKFRIALQSITLWFGATALVYGTIHKISQGIETINELNKSMVNIEMITGMTTEQVQKLTQEYSQLAGTLHETTTEIMKASEEFLRAGHSQEETAKLIQSSTLMSKISSQDQKSSADQLIAITNAFKLSAEQSLDVVDKLVMVDNTSATSTMELGQALERSSASAQMAGVSFSQLVSYIGTVSSVTRKSAESIGKLLPRIIVILYCNSVNLQM